MLFALCSYLGVLACPVKFESYFSGASLRETFFWCPDKSEFPLNSSQPVLVGFLQAKAGLKPASLYLNSCFLFPQHTICLKSRDYLILCALGGESFLFSR